MKYYCKNKVTPIGLAGANSYVDSLMSRPIGRKLKQENERALVLILAYGVDATTAHTAINDNVEQDKSATHAVKKRAITAIDKLLASGDEKQIELTPLVSVSLFRRAAKKVDCTPKELAIIKAVFCYGVDADEIYSYCGIKKGKKFDSASENISNEKAAELAELKSRIESLTK